MIMKYTVTYGGEARGGGGVKGSLAPLTSLVENYPKMTTFF